jgi:Fe-S oxidoreductase
METDLVCIVSLEQNRVRKIATINFERFKKYHVRAATAEAACCVALGVDFVVRENV